jgi:peroxiredoxin
MSATVLRLADFERVRQRSRAPAERPYPAALSRDELPPGTRSADARSLAERLVGLPLPRVLLGSVGGPSADFDFHGCADWRPFVVYIYSGGSGSPDDGKQSPRLDRVQHQAFRACNPEFLALEVGVIGVSSQPTRAQLDSLVLDRLPHQLVSDPRLLLAEQLGLPTFTADEARWYRRLTLVASHGHISKAFFPVSAASSATQAITWIRQHDTRSV